MDFNRTKAPAPAPATMRTVAMAQKIWELENKIVIMETPSSSESDAIFYFDEAGQCQVEYSETISRKQLWQDYLISWLPPLLAYNRAFQKLYSSQHLCKIRSRFLFLRPPPSPSSPPTQPSPSSASTRSKAQSGSSAIWFDSVQVMLKGLTMHFEYVD